jgi:hypothetical protein
MITLTGKVLELLGPTVEFLTSPEDPQNDFCVIRGTVPPGISVPLHSHADTDVRVYTLIVRHGAATMDDAYT